MIEKPNKDSKGIEEKALRCLETFIEDSKIISPYLASNDKEPSWDGHLYVYSENVKDKEHFIGRIPIQVKGTEVKKIVLEKFKFKIEVNDLKAYLHDPAVYVVCQEKENSKDRQLFYRHLLPETIKNILKGKEKQQEISILMHRFPETLAEFENQMKVFMGDSRKQASFADNQKIFTIEDAKKRGSTNLSFCAPNPNMDPFELMKYLSTSPTYLYAKIDEEFDIEIPLEGGPQIFSFCKNIKKEIASGGKVFFNDCVNKIKEGKMYISIDNMLTIYLPGDNNTKPEMKFSSSLLKDNIKMAEFVLTMADSGKLTIGDTELDIKLNNKDSINYFRTNLPQWQKLQSVLDKMNVTKDLDLAGITKDQSHIINILLKTVEEGKAVKANIQKATINLTEISNIKLLLLNEVDKGSMCRLGSFFNHNVKLFAQKNNNEKIEVCLYSYLTDNNLWEKIDNIPYDELIPSYKKLINKNNIYI